MLRRIALLALLLGTPAAIHSAQDWFFPLGNLFDGLWKRTTENTGMSIDPDGKPQSPPQDPSTDTGMSIGPNG
ncbi:MAG TPA: hypothetical protein VF179_15155 [Thermoanaerobaculia bacterium]|nr:hypothetical protein [Thermoanaerobaculia bacterium]